MKKKSTNITGKKSVFKHIELLWARGSAWDYACFLIIIVWIIISNCFHGPILLTEVAPDARRSIFQTIATVSGTMAGLTFTSISIMINLVKTPMSVLDKLTRPEEKRRVGDVFLTVLSRLLFTFVFALVTLSIESGNEIGVWWIEGVVLGFVIASISGMARVVWVLKRLLKLS